MIRATAILTGSLIFMTALSPCYSKSPSIQPLETRILCFQDACFYTEIAVSQQDRVRGLMDRAPLQSSEAMLFVFENPDRYRIWMKQMKGSIDILWLDRDCRVVAINERVPPCTKDPCPTYTSDKNASLILEVAPGTVERLGLEAGSTCLVTPPF